MKNIPASAPASNTTDREELERFREAYTGLFDTAVRSLLEQRFRAWFELKALEEQLARKPLTRLRQQAAKRIEEAAKRYQDDGDYRVCAELAAWLRNAEPLLAPVMDDIPWLSSLLGAWDPEPKLKRGKMGTAKIMAVLAAQFGAWGLPRGSGKSVVRKHTRTLGKSLSDGAE